MADIIEYCQLAFLPVWAELLSQTQIYATDGNECLMPLPSTCQIVVWNHNESIYYADDRQKIR
jgi:hypothetical protein